MGVVSNLDIGNIINSNGITKTPAFGARAVYGNQLHSKNSIYYASYNDNDTTRCFKDLSNKRLIMQNYWKIGDVIKICLFLDTFRIKFFLNDKKVRKTISLQPNKTYYPIISFSGNCRYHVSSNICR